LLESARTEASFEQRLVDAVTVREQSKFEDDPLVNQEHSVSLSSHADTDETHPSVMSSPGWIAGLEGLVGGQLSTEDVDPAASSFATMLKVPTKPSLDEASTERRHAPLRSPAGSGAAVATAARRQKENSIEGIMAKQEQENKQLEALLKKKFHSPPPGTKLPSVNSLPVIPLDKDKAKEEAKRAVRLTYHRLVGPPDAYQLYRQKSAMDLDLSGEGEQKLFCDPLEQEKRFKQQRATYQGQPVKMSPTKSRKVSPPAKGLKAPTRSKSTPVLLPPAGTTSHGFSTPAGEGRTLKKRPPRGADMLKMLADGALPSILCPPV